MTNNWNMNSVPSQEGKTAIVTGANTGLGYETALALAGKGSEVILASRNRNKAEKAITSIRMKYPQAKIHFMHLNLGQLASVRQFTGEFLTQYPSLDLLINNAGVMMPPYVLTADGFESQLGTNYLGHFLLTGLLLPALQAAKDSRVVTVSSMAHKYGNIFFDDLNFTKGYNKIKAYSQSKLACLMFAYELQRRLEKAGLPVRSLAAHPGVSATDLGRNMSPVLRYFFPKVGQKAEAGALPLLMAAFDTTSQGGEYYGPDGWNEMRGNPKIVGSSKLSKNPAVASRLWEVSEQLVGFSYPV
jgi:NAD(P)-dependent dehydrogenase (short-subunit alcohol dehydrogenase family)